MVPIHTYLRLVNDSTPGGDGWWHWSSWIEGTDDELRAVTAVTYLLHPTFRPQRHRVTDRGSKFKLSASAWGEFLLTAELELTDKSTTRLERWLELRSATNHDREGGDAWRPRVFVSSSLGDAPLVRALTDGLRHQGVDVATADSLDVNTDLGSGMKRVLRTVDAVIPVFSGSLSRWVAHEASEAQSIGRPLIPVVVGQADVPSILNKIQHFHIEDGRKVPPGLADSIAARVKDLVTPEET